MSRHRKWGAYGLITTPLGVMMIKEPEKEDSNCWRLPGGGSEPTDLDELETFRREIAEELNLELYADKAEFRLLHYFKQGELLQGYSRPAALYGAHFEDPRWYRPHGPNGEEVRIFPFAQPPRNREVFRLHLDMLEKAGAWPVRAPLKIAA